MSSSTLADAAQNKTSTKPLETEKIKILHIITRMVKGGAQEDVLDLTVRVDSDRFESILVTGPSDGPEGSLIEKSLGCGAKIFYVPTLVREVSPLSDLKAFLYLTRLIKVEKPDVVHTHTSKAGIIGRLAAKRAGVPVTIHSPHGHVFHGYYGKIVTSVFIALERWCARFADRLIMITENERTDHIALNIAPPNKFVIIHSGVDFTPLLNESVPRGTLRKQLGIDERAIVIGTVGRLVPIKGQIHLIEAMPTIVKQIPSAKLVLVGSGPLDSDLKAAVARMGLSDSIVFAGYRTDVGTCLQDMDMFVLPSLNEGMGRALVEAMAMRLPVVASDVCGIRDLVQHDINGKLVAVGDSAGLSTAILALLNDKEFAQKLGARAYDTVVPQYGVEAMLTEIEALYIEEVNRQRGR